MSEIINAYPLDNPDKLFPIDRKEFYKNQIEEIEKNWTPSMAVEVVNVFLFNESWELILQKRSSSKSHNANLIDKSIWGHIVNWDNPDFTVMLESVQELQVPSIVLRNHNDFLKTFFLLKDYIRSTSVIEYLDTKIFHIPKIINWKKIIIPNKTHVYMWVYWWSVKNVDKEAKWVLFYDIDELKEEIEQFPDMFTNDLKYFINKYAINFNEFIKTITIK